MKALSCMDWLILLADDAQPPFSSPEKRATTITGPTSTPNGNHRRSRELLIGNQREALEKAAAFIRRHMICNHLFARLMAQKTFTTSTAKRIEGVTQSIYKPTSWSPGMNRFLCNCGAYLINNTTMLVSSAISTWDGGSH